MPYYTYISKSIYPHGSTTKLCPYKCLPGNGDPTTPAATTNEQFSIALALYRECQWASPVFYRNAAGFENIVQPFVTRCLNTSGNLRS